MIIKKYLVFLVVLIFLAYIIFLKTVSINPGINSKTLLKNNETIINPHDYVYIINPSESICRNKIVTLLVFVLTKRDHFIQRETIRKTWSNKKLFLQMHVIFILGSSNDIQLDKKIEKESNRYNDIVQESFQDSYLNLTLKTIQGIKWVSKYVLKVDDDVLVNSYSLLSHLDNLKLKTTNNILCYVHLNAPIERDLNSKFYVSSNEKKERRTSIYVSREFSN